jgi:hypothetical protein
MLLNPTTRNVHWPNEENTLAGKDVSLLLSKYLQSQPVIKNQELPFQNHLINKVNQKKSK